MYDKIRDTSRFIGEVQDTLYYASSGNAYLNTLPSLDDSAAYQKIYEQAKLIRATNLAVPQYVGYERIAGHGQGRGTMNYVRHSRLGLVNVPYLHYYRDYRYGTLGTLARFNKYWRYTQPNVLPWSLSDLHHPVVDYAGARSRAWWNMQPRFVGEVDMLNFLFELKDFRDIVKSTYKLKGTIEKYRYNLNKRWRKTSPEPSRALAGAWLFKSFAYDPLLSDIAKIATQAAVIVRDAQKKFDEAGERWQKSHFSEEISRTDSRTRSSNSNYYWVGSGDLRTTMFTATLRYMYDYQLRPDWKAFVDYWGLSFNFNRWWNATPFSFLVDYFLTVGASIKAMETDKNVDIQQTQYCESLKTTLTRGYSVFADPRDLLYVYNGQFMPSTRAADLILAGHQGILYERRPTDPYKGPVLPRIKLPSTKQSLNMLALARCFL